MLQTWHYISCHPSNFVVFLLSYVFFWLSTNFFIYVNLLWFKLTNHLWLFPSAPELHVLGQWEAISATRSFFSPGEISIWCWGAGLWRGAYPDAYRTQYSQSHQSSYDKKEIIFHLSIHYVYHKEFRQYCHGSNCWREEWNLVAFLGQFYNLHLYPEYLYDHRNGTKGEWVLWLCSASAEIGAKFHSRDETENI